MPALQQFGTCIRRGGLAGSSRARALPAGVSLAELLVSLVIIAILMTAMGSVMVLTGHVVGLSAAHAGEARVDDVVATIAAEQRLASRITERTAKSITFVVDRDHDGVSETVRYAWSGNAGDPLTRSSNGGAPITLIPSVKRFNLSYLVKSTAAATPVPDVEIGSDVLLYSHDAGSSGSPVTTSNWVGQYFKPDWATVAPGKTVTGWRVTKVEFIASRATGAATTAWVVRLYPAVNDAADRRPLLTSLREEQSLSVVGMSTVNPPTLRYSSSAFTTNSGLDQAKGMVVTIGPNAFSPSGNIGFDASSTDAAGAMSTSGNSGVSYNAASTTRDLRVRVYGRYKYPGP